MVSKFLFIDKKPQYIKWCLLILLLLSTQSAFSQNNSKGLQIDPEPFADNFHHWYKGFDKQRVINPLPNKPRYKPTQLKEIGNNIVLFQKDNGGWAKNYDVFAILTPEQKDSVLFDKKVLNTTYDNGTCYTQIAALATVYKATKEKKYEESALKGLNYILESQYSNGGWPQFYPLEEDYSKCITYNDGAMDGVMQLLKEILDNKPLYLFIDAEHREKLVTAYNKGLDCILKTQINDAGNPTAWCQQYDEVTLQPAWARKFEPPSICNGESADLVLFLMSINHPSQVIINAVQNSVVWFQDSKIYNTKVKSIPAPRLVTPFRVSTTDKVVVTDSAAPPIWARYYELNTHKPIFCDRNSKIVYSLAEITRERRDGYSWYNYKPQKVLNSYPKWQKKWVADKNVLQNK